VFNAKQAAVIPVTGSVAWKSHLTDNV